MVTKQREISHSEASFNQQSLIITITFCIFVHELVMCGTIALHKNSQNNTLFYSFLPTRYLQNAQLDHNWQKAM